MKRLEWQEHDFYRCPGGCGEWWPNIPDEDEPHVKGIKDSHIRFVWQGDRKRGKRGGSKRAGRKRRKPRPKRRPYELI
ncbi:MAG: hypothetical protein C4570_06490 [Ammonifex sp.]|jgi:hypothetical protein|nr:MAG: hypothetical protein C4570_06490 [Ammonifex sp.]